MTNSVKIQCKHEITFKIGSDCIKSPHFEENKNNTF